MAGSHQAAIHGQRRHEAQHDDGDGHRPGELLKEVGSFTHAHYLVRNAEIRGHAALGVLNQHGEDDQHARNQDQTDTNRVQHIV